MSAKKNQHYVPQSYLRFFSNDGKNIGVFIIKEQKIIPSASISSQVSEDYFYSKNIRIEEDLDYMEGKGMLAFHKLINRPNYRLHEVERLNVICYIVLQYGRTLAAVNKIESSTNEFGLRLFKEYVGHNDIDPHLRFGLEEPGVFALNVISNCILECSDLSYKVLEIDSHIDSHFITSDNPVCLFNPLFDMHGCKGAVGLGHRGLCMLMPLTPSLAIILFDHDVYKMGNSNSHMILKSINDISIINRIVASNANEILLFNNVFSISYEIRSLSKNGTLDSYVRTYDNKGPRLSFIHILDKAKMGLFNFSEETLYRKYFLYLSRHPEVKKQLEESMTSISEEERKAFYKLLKDRK